MHDQPNAKARTPAPEAATVEEDGPLAGRREWIALAVLMLPLLLVSMDTSVLYFAVPFISRELLPSASQQLWIFDIYGFVLAGLLITMGSISDRIGRRRLLIIGTIAFGVASVVAAYSTSPEALIGARALLGIGGATLMPSTLALVRNMFKNAKQRITAITIWMSMLSLGVSIGPVVSGALLNHFWWGSVFLINVPAVVLLVIIAPLLVPEFKDPNPNRFDVVSSFLSLAAVLPVIYGIQKAAADGFSIGPILFVVVGLLVGIVFVWRQAAISNPMIDLHLFRDRGFSSAITINSMVMFVLIGFVLFTTQFLQSVLGLSALSAALWSLIPSLAVGVAGPVAAILGMRMKRSHAIAVAFVIAAAGYTGQAQATQDTHLWYILTCAFISSTGVIMLLALVGDLLLASIPADRAATASSISETGQQFGGALGMAVLGSIGAAVYRSSFGDQQPDGVPPSVLAVAKQTLGNAVSAAQELPAEGSSALLRTARDAFSDGMFAAGLTAAGLLLIAAVLSVIFLRDVVPAGEPAAESQTPVDHQAEPTKAPPVS
ncbi:MFS transporter [Nocardia sp. NPDC050175]|uniref:MFS transporter n=1 Tax=Nocardia sp. NPDC050175 TaxID=3364317 RepID=UPI0037906423